MASPFDIRQRVFVACRAIFSGDDAQLRKQAKIKKLVRKHRILLAPLLAELKEPLLVDILRRLLEARIFESPSHAKAEFPALFLSSPQRDADREAAEVDAARSVNEVLVDDNLSDDEGCPLTEGSSLENGEACLPGSQDDFAWLKAPSNAHITKQTTAPAVELSSEPATTPAEATAVKVPSLYPSVIPYSAQHLILTTAQQILEECCFDFARAQMPNVVQSHGWDCAAAVELTKWKSIFTDKRCGKLPGYTLSSEKPSLRELSIQTHALRHTAVHRLATPARGISQLLQPAIDLAEALKDSKRVSQLKTLKSEVDGKIKAMELNKNVLENEAGDKLKDIQRQRAELARQENELVENMLREDQSNKALVGRLLEQAVGTILAPGTGSLKSKERDEVDGHSTWSGSEEEFSDVYEYFETPKVEKCCP